MSNSIEQQYQCALDACRVKQQQALAQGARKALRSLLEHERDLLRDMAELADLHVAMLPEEDPPS